MIRRLARALVALAIFAGLTACGGTELKPDQQKEYDALQAEKRAISGRIGSAKSRAEKAFRDLGAAEKKYGIHFKHLVLCGGNGDGNVFGPFPWGAKKKARFQMDRTVKVRGATCRYYTLKVVK